MAGDESGGEQPIIIKRIKKGGGHHGGAWKVAYADFVTAMMAFFLLLWLLGSTSEEQKEELANYFDPTHAKVSDSQSGAGGVMGGTSLAVDGSMVSDTLSMTPAPNSVTTNTMNAAQASNTGNGTAPSKSEDGEQFGEAVPTAVESAIAQAEEELKKAEQDALESAKKAIEKAIQENPELKDLAENLIVDMTPEGLRIQIVDAKGKPMFASGSARMYQKTKTLMAQVSKIIKELPNEVSLRGHTDSIPYGSGADYTNWDLSTDRANSSRRALLESGLQESRINNVVGKADTEHLLPDDPTNARNRRVSITLLREELTDPEGYKKRAEALAKKKMAEQAKNAPPPSLPTGGLPTTKKAPNSTPSIPSPETGDFKPSEGVIQFP